MHVRLALLHYLSLSRRVVDDVRGGASAGLTVHAVFVHAHTAPFHALVAMVCLNEVGIARVDAGILFVVQLRLAAAHASVGFIELAIS